MAWSAELKAAPCRSLHWNNQRVSSVGLPFHWLAFVVGWLVPSALMLGLQDALVMMTHDYNFLSCAELAKVSQQFTGHL
jgi:hypothetical protein